MEKQYKKLPFHILTRWIFTTARKSGLNWLRDAFSRPNDSLHEFVLSGWHMSHRERRYWWKVANRYENAFPNSYAADVFILISLLLVLGTVVVFERGR
jgi:hypothetical protein